MNRYVAILKKSWIISLVCVLLISIVCIVIYIKFSNSPAPFSLEGAKLYVWMILWAIMFLSPSLYIAKCKKNIKCLNNRNLVDKLTLYRKYFLHQLLACIADAFAALIATIFIKDTSVLMICIISLIYIIACRPSAIRVKFDLYLNEEDLSKFNHLKFS